MALEHNMDSGGMVGNISLMVNLDWLSRVTEKFPTLSTTIQSFIEHSTAFMLRGDEQKQIARLLEESVHVDEAVLPLKIIECLFAVARCSDVVSLVDKNASKDDIHEKLLKIRIYIICNYMRKILLTNAARKVGMSRSLFCAFFKKATGTTFINAVNDCRIEEACRLLKTTTLSVSEISDRVGYSDVSYFNRQFKARRGCSPLKWGRSGLKRPTAGTRPVRKAVLHAVPKGGKLLKFGGLTNGRIYSNITMFSLKRNMKESES